MSLQHLRPAILAVGAFALLFAVLMLVCGAVSAGMGGLSGGGFVLSAAIVAFIGGGLLIASHDTDPGRTRPSARTAFALTGAAWFGGCLVCAVPFVIVMPDLTLAEAVFEATSGLTSSGSTVLVGLDRADRGILLWRAMLQWVGGVGIILMVIALLPFLRVGGMELFALESSDKSSEKMVARPQELVRLVGSIYGILTIGCAIAYSVGGMETFDAITHAMTTVSTGGFSNYDASFGYFRSGVLEWIAIVFMIAGALPFFAYIRLARGERNIFAADPQILVFLVGLAAISLAAGLALHLETPGADFATSLRRAAFNVISITTTTGYASENYILWGAGFVGMFFVLTFFGGAAGSTVGGVKTYRFVVLFLIARDHLARLYDPKSVRTVKYGERRITDDVAVSVLAFLALFVGAFAVGTLLLTFTGLDLETAASGAAVALCNVGPGLGPIIGPAGTFAPLTDAAKWICSGLMLLGRLELFVLIALLDPRFWRG